MQSSHKKVVPKNFEEILKEYTKAIIKNQPKNVYKFSYKYFLNLSNKSSDKETTLTEQDRAAGVANLLVAYFFDSIVDEDKLKSSLNELVEHIPLLSSVIEKRKGETDLFVLKHVPNNIKITKKIVEDDVYDLFDIRKPGIIDYKEGGKLHSLMENVKTGTPTNPVNLPLQEPVMKITLLKTKTSNHSIIGVSLNHSVGDGQSFIQLMKCWEEIFNGKSRKDLLEFNHNRKLIFDKESDKEPTKEQLLKLGFFYPLNLQNLGIAFSKKYETTNLLFTNKRIKELKELVKIEERFSTHDVLCAYIWKLMAHIRFDVGDDHKCPLLFVMNYRQKTSFIPNNYFGNVTANMFTEITKKEIKECSFSELVKKLRGRITNFNDEDALLINKQFKGLKKPDSPFPWLYGSTFDDWRFFSDVMPVFGNSKCKRFSYTIPNGIVAPNFHIMIKTDEGITMCVQIVSEVFEKIKDINLTDSNAFVEIEKRLTL